MTVSQQDHFVNLVLKLLSNDEPLDTIYKTLIEFFEELNPQTICSILLGQRVIVEDIQTDPLWEQYRDLAKSANVASCWSQPIKAQNGEVLETFAIYHTVKHTPSERDIQRLLL